MEKKAKENREKDPWNNDGDKGDDDDNFHKHD